MDILERICPNALSIKNNTLEVSGKGESPSDGRLLLATATDKCYETQVEITTGKGNQGGLLLYYNEKAYAGIVSDGKTFTVYRGEKEPLTKPSIFGKHSSPKS